MSEVSKINQNIIIKKVDKETINIRILDNEIVMSIVGQFNQNLEELEKLTNTTIFFRGNSLTIKGKDENIIKVSEAIKFLANKYFLTNLIEKNDILLSVKKNIVSKSLTTLVPKWPKATRSGTTPTTWRHIGATTMLTSRSRP